MMKMISKLHIAMLAIAMMAVSIANAADVECYSRGVAHTILNDGSGNFPIVEAGEVFVSLSSEVTPAYEEGTYTSEVAVNVGSASSGSVKQTFYFWARAKQGYKFIGWNTSKTGKTPASGSDVEGAPYAKTYTHWSAGTAEAPKEQTLYAIFEKLVDADTEPSDQGDGASFVSVADNEYLFGNSSKNYSVKVYFSEGLQFVDKSAAQEGYGVNNALLPYVTCQDANGQKVNVVKVTVNAAYAEGSYTEFQPAYGVIELPYTMPVGTYTVHLPYGLFNTQTGGVTASCNFQVVVNADNTPLTLVSHQPANGYVWNANPDDENCDGESVMVTLNYNKTLVAMHTEEAVSLTNASGRMFAPESCTIGVINKSQGLVSFGKLPNGTYTFSMPANVFEGTNGMGNEALTFSFSVTGSLVDEWALPTYTHMSVSPSNNSKVRSLTNIGIQLSREGYEAPVGVLTNKGNVTASKIVYTYPEGTDPDDPEVLPTLESVAIDGVSASVEHGVLMVNFATPFSDSAKVVINIPAGIVNNLAMPVANMTAQEIYEEGGCTNAAIELQYDVCPVAIPVLDVTGIGTFSHWDKDEEGHDVRVDSYTSLVGAQLVPPVNNGDGGDRITYLYFWYPEEFVALNYTGGASVVNLSNQRPYNIAAIEFKTGGDAYRNNVIQMRLSTENFIHSDVYDQGIYEVVLPAGIARTADGMLNEGFSFQFTYGDPDKAYHPEEVNLDAYLGNYRNVREEGETLETEETFEFQKVDGKYYVTALCGSPLQIQVEANADSFVLKFAENSDGDAFMSYAGGDVVANFAQQGGKSYIFIDQYALYFANGQMLVGGATYYEQYTTSGIQTLHEEASHATTFNLNGQRTDGTKGFVVGKRIKAFVK